MKPEEHEMAIAVDWLDAAGFGDCYFHVPNESGTRASVQWHKKRKRLGVRSGVPDLHVIRTTASGAPGLVWEMKSPTGRLSPSQRLWLLHYTRSGWEVGHGPAWKFIEKMREAYGL